MNFLAANVSQLLAGVVELGLGFLTPFFLLLVVGVSPATAGIALIPATLPIILAGPLAGRAFDRMGGRWPLVAGFTILAASGVVLALSVSSESATALIPGLLLQGLGLGIVLTVNDPTGLTAVPPEASGQAAGMINTAEQLGGAVGIAALTAIELGINFHEIYSRLAARGIHPTPEQNRQAREFVIQAEQKGLHNVSAPPAVKTAIHDLVTAHVIAFQWTFSVSAGIALVGALVALVLVRRSDRVREGPVFARRSRWIAVGQGRSPAVTRRPPLEEGAAP
jgi:MFS family permease